MDRIRVRLIRDWYHLKHIGQTQDGLFCWICGQLNAGRDFVATYIFDSEGVLVEYDIIDLGRRGAPDELSARRVIKEQKVRFGFRKTSDFWIYPFAIEAHDTVFGLVERVPEPGEQQEFQLIDALPGWTLMFYPPWEEGRYDT
jgi:hypothetical protein